MDPTMFGIAEIWMLRLAELQYSDKELLAISVGGMW